MFDKFTANTKKVFDRARIQAKVNSNPEVGSAHVLLGILGEDECIAAKVLSGSLSVDKIMDAAKRVIDALPKENGAKKEPKYSADVKAVMDKSLELATSLKSSVIGTEHLLLAILQPENPANQILESLGAIREDLQDKVLNYIDDQDSASGTSASQIEGDGTNVGIVAVLDNRLREDEVSRIMVAISQLRGVVAVDVMNVRLKEKESSGIVKGRMKSPLEG